MNNKLDTSISSFIKAFPVLNFSSLEFSELGLISSQKLFSFNAFSGAAKLALDELQDRLPVESRTVVIIDDAFNLKDKVVETQLVLVKDHMNLSTQNPLLGPNDEARGQRFFSVNDVYLKPAELGELEKVVVVGLNQGSHPKDSEKLILKLHSDCYSYNLVLASLLAAHHGFRVIGLLNIK